VFFFIPTFCSNITLTNFPKNFPMPCILLGKLKTFFPPLHSKHYTTPSSTVTSFTLLKSGLMYPSLTSHHSSPSKKLLLESSLTHHTMHTLNHSSNHLLFFHFNISSLISISNSSTHFTITPHLSHLPAHGAPPLSNEILTITMHTYLI
jgi:hypothetical protein